MKRTAAQIEESIALNEGRTEGCGWYVVVGLAVELVVAIAFRDHRSLVESLASVLADVFVVGGVYGEVRFSRKLRIDVEDLQRISNERIAELGVQAAEAIKRASAADQKAAEAQLEVARIRAPRSLTNKTAADLVSVLRTFPGEPVMLAVLPGDPEAVGLWAQISSVLEQAGWKASRWGARDTFVETAGGLVVQIVPGGDPKHAVAAGALCKALQNAGLQALFGPPLVLGNPDSWIRLIIGRKP